MAKEKNEIPTLDLEEFSGYALRETRDILIALINKNYHETYINDFYENKLKIMYNQNSNCVFLTNDDYQTAMLNNEKLEMFYSCSYCGYEGFIKDMVHNPENEECIEYMKQIGIKIPDNYNQDIIEFD